MTVLALDVHILKVSFLINIFLSLIIVKIRAINSWVDFKRIQRRKTHPQIFQITFVSLQLHAKQLGHLNPYFGGERQWVENKTSQKDKILD